MPTRTHQSQRRLARPPSKQILQLRNEDENHGGTDHYDAPGASPYPCSSGCSSSWNSPPTDDISDSSNVIKGVRNDDDASLAAAGTAMEGEAGMYLHHSNFPHVTQYHQHLQQQDQQSRPTSRNNNHHVDRMTRRASGGAGPRSSNTRAYPAVSRDGQRSQQCDSNRHGSNSGGSRLLKQSSMQLRCGASPFTTGGYVKYYGPPPVTAVISPSQSSTSLADVASTSSSPIQRNSVNTTTTFPTTGNKQSQQQSTCGLSDKTKTTNNYNNHDGFDDAGRAPLKPPGASATPANAATSLKATTMPSTDNGSVDLPAKSSETSDSSSCETSRATTAAGENTSDSPSPPALNTPSSCLRLTSADNTATQAAAGGTATAEPTMLPSPTCTLKNTPLTYATVVSGASSTSSSFYGKRLPQSRVGFGNFRKRVCGSGSAGSTVHSTQGMPALTGSPSQCSRTDAGNSYMAHDCCASSCGFPSVPLTQQPGSDNTINNHHMPGGVDNTCATVDEGAAGNEEDGDGGDGDDDNVAFTTTSNHEISGETSQLEARECNLQRQQQQQQRVLMTPLPPSLHRNHPTNLFLELPHQHVATLDSDEEATVSAGPDSKAYSCTGTRLRKLLPVPTQPHLTLAAHLQKTNNQDSSNNSEAGPILSVSATTVTPTSAQRQTSATMQNESHRCLTSSTVKHTGPAVAAKAAAGLHLMPVASPTFTPLSWGTPSTSSTPSALTVQEAPQQQPQQKLHKQSTSIRNGFHIYSSSDPSKRYLASNVFTPTNPAPPTISKMGKATPKVTSTVNSFNAAEIIPGLFLGTYSDATDTEVLASHGISLVINCSQECAVTPAMAHNSNHVRYVQCPLRDHSDEPISPFLVPVTQIIHEQLHRRQINQQRVRKGKSNGIGTRFPGAGMRSKDLEGGEDKVRGTEGGCCCDVVLAGGIGSSNAWVQDNSTHLDAASTDGRAQSDNSNSSDVSDSEDVLQDRMLWTWADEAENIWAVPTSPASPPSVGGQPSLKEGKHETPHTPLSAANVWGGRNSNGSTSLFTSEWPSPMPDRTETFLGVSKSPAAATEPLTNDAGKGKGANIATTQGGSGSATTTAKVSCYSLGYGVNGPATTATVTANTPLTVVDPRDCGGILVHCRMGVSRSATFVIAYLILYGFTLANLEDTASLFVNFLERERVIMEEAGGRARFSFDANGNAAAMPSAVQEPTTTTNTDAGNAVVASLGFSSPQMQVHPHLRTESLSQRSHFSTAVTSPTGSEGGSSTPTSTTPGARRQPNGFTSRYTQRNSNSNSTSNSSNTNNTTVLPPMHASPALVPHRRSAAISVASPLFLNSGSIVVSPRSTTSPSQLRFSTQLTPLEICSRVCRPCHLQRLRERRLQQQVKHNLLISGQLQRWQEDKEEQMIGLAAFSRTRGEQQRQQQLSNGSQPLLLSGLGAGRGRCIDCDCDLLSNTNNGNNDVHCNFYENSTLQHLSDDPEQQQRQSQSQLQQHFTLRSLSASAPVVSYRGSRGSFGMGGTLLEVTLEDEVQSDEVHDDDDTEAQRNVDMYSTATKRTLNEDQYRVQSESRGANSANNKSVSDGGTLDTPPLRNAFSVSNTSVAVTITATPTTDQGAGAQRFTSNVHSAQPQLSYKRQGTTTAMSSALYNSPRYTSNRSTTTPLCTTGVAATSNNATNDTNNTPLYASYENGSIASSHSVFSGDLAPAMTFREAFDAVKKQKADVNPNIGFVLALRELAGNGDFSFSTSL